MKILMLVPFLPNASTSGGQTRWYNIIKYMSHKHDITLFSLIKDESERKFIPELEKYCNKVRVFSRPASPWTPKYILKAELGLQPLVVVRNWSRYEKAAIEEELNRESYDLIHAEAFYVMPHIPKTDVPTILVEQTIEYLVYKHYVDNEVPFYLKPFYMLDVIKCRFWEKFYWRKANQLVAVSADDRTIMKQLVPGIDVGIIPNGVDCQYYADKKVAKLTPQRVLYGVTNFEWLQNREAVEILIYQVWPKIVERMPEAILWIVGRKIPQEIVALANSRADIEVTESIADPRDAYGGASVMVTPIRGSGGTRLKILEAMASGLPVVSTSTGVAGLSLIEGKHALISDDMDELAQKTVLLLNNQKLAQKIGSSAREFVVQNYDWKVIVGQHEPIYKGVVNGKKYKK